MLTDVLSDGTASPEASRDCECREPTAEAAAWRRVHRVAAAVLLASLVPGNEHDPPRKPPLAVDKLAHAVGHGALAAALFDALRHRRGQWRAATLATVLSGGSGLVLELLQRWVPGRRYEHEDVLAGAFGSVAGVVAVARIRRDGRR